MRHEYSIALLALAVATGALASECPPAVTAMARQVAALRELPASFAPPCRSISQEMVAKELDRKLRRDLAVPPELFIESLWRLGFITEDPVATYPKVLELYRSQVLGFFEPATNEMVLVEGAVDLGVQGAMIWAHELAHAGQERRFKLPSRLLAMRTDGDRQRAASAIAEGEALLVMLAVNAAGASPDDIAELAVPLIELQAQTMVAPSGVPDYFLRDLLFPYTTGLATVLRAYQRGGWQSVDALLANPPGSTAELLEPGRTVTRPPLTNRDLPSIPPGLSEILSDSLGQWNLGFWLGRSIGQKEGERLATAWDGDRLRLARTSTTPARWALAWRIRCRDEARCRELTAALQQHTPELLRNLNPAEPFDIAWVTGGRAIELRAWWRPAPRSQRSPS
jgi:hypothetical protein